jgi:biofilm PGA synthesis N-glycosyltransferase PgaC
MHWLLLIVLIPYIYLLLKIYFNLSGAVPFSAEQKPEIFASVVIACRNEERNLPQLLKELSEQDYHADNYEVVIVDDNSSDHTFETASHFKLIKNLKVIHNQGSGKKQAIRTGISTSSGNLIITTDADCRIGNRWLGTIASFYERHKPDMIICPVKLEGGSGFLRKFQELEFLSLQGVTAGSALSGDPVMCNGASLAFTKRVYANHSGNLHEELVSGDDVFLLHSIKREPGNLIMWLESEEAIVTTCSSATTGAFLLQRARWISKAGAYNDMNTRLLAIVTFVTILLQLFLLVAGIFNPVFLLVFVGAFLMKSIPDYLILKNSTLRYNKTSLMKWFIISQAIYPVYILSVLISLLCRKSEFRSRSFTSTEVVGE